MLVWRSPEAPAGLSCVSTLSRRGKDQWGQMPSSVSDPLVSPFDTASVDRGGNADTPSNQLASFIETRPEPDERARFVFTESCPKRTIRVDTLAVMYIH